MASGRAIAERPIVSVRLKAPIITGLQRAPRARLLHASTLVVRVPVVGERKDAVAAADTRLSDARQIRVGHDGAAHAQRPNHTHTTHTHTPTLTLANDKGRKR